MTQHHELEHIYRGTVQQRYGLKTAIDKLPIHAPVWLSALGLDGDQCASVRHHGGPDRALHQYPMEHYDYWRDLYGDVATWCAPGMGENLSSVGMTEKTVCLGDRYQWGDAVIEVSQPRSPCYKLNKRWGVDGFSTKMQETSRCGWLYRVIQEGVVSAQDPLILIEQVTSPITLHALCALFFGDPLQPEGLSMLRQQHTLSASWMNKVIQRQETHVVENWSMRLNGAD